MLTSKKYIKDAIKIALHAKIILAVSHAQIFQLEMHLICVFAVRDIMIVVLLIAHVYH